MLKVYTAYDVKTAAWIEPFTCLNRGSANRLIEELCNDPKTLFCKYPTDFQFFEIGEWDQQTGQIVMFETKFPLGSALEFKRAPEADSPLLPSRN